MSAQPAVRLIPFERGFDYSHLSPELAQKARSTAAAIKERVKKTLLDTIRTGLELNEMKRLLPHGEFTPWLDAEFGWQQSTALNFRHVADWLGDKLSILTGFKIHPTAAYKLAAPTAPEGARQEALERAEAGEEITPPVANAILAAWRKESKSRQLPAYVLKSRLGEHLERYFERWPEDRRGEMLEQLRDFVRKCQGKEASSEKEQQG